MLVTVREFARLTTDDVASSPDQATISASAFDWLCSESARLSKSGAQLVQIDGRRWLRLDNYVGVLETPCGTRIEILPKHVDGVGDHDAATARRVLQSMIMQCLSLVPRESGASDVQAFDAPVTEWVMRKFLDALDHLVKRGMRFDYHAVREEQRHLRGRLDTAAQLRQPPGRRHMFHIEHDVFDADRPENRLLRSALERVRLSTRDAGNWRLSHELATCLSSIPSSTNVDADFRRWRDDRLMAHYRAVRPWCSLVLNERNPLSTLGDWHGISLLFPMERLFERYVEACLRRRLPTHVRLTTQASGMHLCQHYGQRWFQLRPDFLLEHDARWIVDTKWKRLDASLANPDAKYGLAQADFYQLFAYGQKYLEGSGDMFLVYPKTKTFETALPPFHFDDGLRLWVVPFDLEAGWFSDVDRLPAPFLVEWAARAMDRAVGAPRHRN